MLNEILTYLTAKSTKEARAMGHLYESISLIQREKRCHKFWLSHRTHCKNFIIQEMNKVETKNSVLILGSGPLHEIPIIDLASQFDRVDLVDVVHLKTIKNKYAHLKNVFFIEADITELEVEILRTKKIFNKIPSLLLNNHYSLVISANLLSQLPYHLKKYLENKANPKLTELELETFCYQVSADHYKYISQFSCPVLLITDLESHYYGPANDELIEIQKPYINFSLPEAQESWWWNVAPAPELSKEYSLKMKVSAFTLNIHLFNPENPTLI